MKLFLYSLSKSEILFLWLSGNALILALNDSAAALVALLSKNLIISTILFVVSPLISMFVNVNGLTNLPMKSSVMTGIYPNLTVHGSILSSSLF